MRRLVKISILLLVLAGCEKDLEINEDYLTDQNLESYLSTFDDVKIVEDLFAFAGKSDFFERETSNFPIHIYAAIPDLANEMRVYSSDSIQYPDSLELYEEIDLEFEDLEDGFFTRFIDNDSLSDKILRICYQSGDSLHISIPIEMRAATQITKPINGIFRELNSQGFLLFDWSSIPATEFYLLTMIDPFGDLTFALQTRRSDFSFYDLRYVENVLFQAEIKPELVPNYEYQFSVFALSSDGWLNATASDTFVAE